MNYPGDTYAPSWGSGAACEQPQTVPQSYAVFIAEENRWFYGTLADVVLKLNRLRRST